MNITRLKQLRRYLKGLNPSKFNLRYWFNSPVLGWKPENFILNSRTNRNALEGDCGSVACIAGHAMALFAPDDIVADNPGISARNILDLNYAQANQLFEPETSDHSGEDSDLPEGLGREDITIAQAVRAISILIETGEVDWKAACR